MHFVRDRKPKQWKRCLIISVLLTFMLTGHITPAAAADDTNGVLRSRAYKFRHITSQQAREMLLQLKLGKSIDILNDKALIVTSNDGLDLIRATEVVTVLDQAKPVQIHVLMVADKNHPLPELDAFIAQMSMVSAGTMKDAPPKGSKNPAIIDIQDNKLIVIAAQELIGEIETGFEEWKKQNPSPQSPEQPAQEKPVEMQPVQPGAELVPIEESISLEEIAAQLLQENKEEDKTDEPAQEVTEVVEEAATETNAVELVPVKMTEPAMEEDLLDMLKTEPNTTEEYIGDELLRELLDEEEMTSPQPPQPEVEMETAQTTQSEPATDDALQKAMEMLLKSSQQEQPEPQAESEQVPVATEPAEVVQRSEAVSENLKLQRELALLRQQMTELQTQVSSSDSAVTEKPQKQPEEAEVLEPEIEPESEPVVEDEKTEYEKAIDDEMLETTIDLPQEVEIEALVDLVGKQLGLNYMYDPAILKNQKVLLKIHQGKIKVKEIYGVLESVLRLKGFVMTRRDDLVTIIKSADAAQTAAQMDTTIRTPDDPIQPGDVIVSTIFKLENIRTASAKAILSQMKLGLANGYQEIPETNTLIVTDYAYRMPRIEDALRMTDVAGDEKKFEHRQLKYMQAADLVDKLKELVEQVEGVSMQTGTPAKSATPPKTRSVRKRNPKTGKMESTQVPVDVATPSAKQADKKTVFIDTDERTNRILIIGTAAQIAIINQLVDTLDVPQQSLKFIREYIIQYVEAVEVVDVLNELGLATVSVSASSSSTTAPSSRRTTARTTAQKKPQTTPKPPTASGKGAGDNQPNISVRPATNSLLVNATEEQHQAIELVIAHVDVVQKDQRTIREYEIQYVDTQEIIDTMTDLGMISSKSVRGSSSSQTDRRSNSRNSRTNQQQQQAMAEGPAPMLTGFGAEEGGSPEDVTAQEPQIAVLEATNSLLVYATPRQHDAIALLIAHADRTPEISTTPYVVYALENQDPLELAEVLTQLIQETVEEVGKKSSPDSKIQKSGAASSTAGKLPTLEEEKIRVIPDPMSYSLIVYANKRNQQWISELIKELDEYRPQVLLDCTLVEVTKDDGFNYSLNLIGKAYTDGSSIQTDSPVATDAVYGDFSTQGTLVDASAIAGNVTAFLNAGSVQALLEATQTNGYGRIMAQPKILVNDNQEGVIKTQNTTSIAQQSSNIIPGTGTSSSITTTDVTFSPYDEGVTLTIKPHISKGDMLRLDINLVRIDFTEKSDVTVAGETYPRPPDLLSTDVTTIATVPDGTTIILGGLESVDQNKSQDKVPILGDLPLVGALFRSVVDSDAQSKLYIFVKANIIRPGDQAEGLEDIRRVSEKYRQKFEDMEERFQGLQDVPGIDPKPMDPLKVLEEDMGVELIEE